MEAQVKQLNKDLGHINTLIERKNIKKKHKDGLERRHKLKGRGLPVTREEIKERIKANNNKIKRYQSRINQYQNFKCDFEYKDEQEEVEITPEKIKKILRKMPNWKAPGLDCAQGVWLKKYSRRS